MPRVGFAFFLVLALAAPAAAKDASSDELDLEDELEFLAEDVVFSAARHEQKRGFSPSAVIVITREDIEASPAATLVELLRHYPAVHLLVNNPSHTLVHLRGSYRVLLMLDGRELNQELFPAAFFESLNVGLNEIERIEIVLGPNSALYGANAVSAVINVISRKPGPRLKADAELAAGSNGATIANAFVEGGIGNWALRGTFGLDQENSWHARDAPLRDIMRGRAVARWTPGAHELLLDASLMDGNIKFFSDALGDMPLDFKLIHTQAIYEYENLSARVWWYAVRGQLDIDLDLKHPNDESIILGRLPTMNISGDTAHGEMQYDLQLSDANLLIGGIDFRYTNYRSPQTVGKSTSEYRLGIFLHDEHMFADCLLLTGGLRFDYNTKTGNALSPQLAVVYNPAGTHYLRLSGGTAFRKPTLIESSTNFLIDADPAFPEVDVLFEDMGISNPDLDNELLSTVELGYSGSFFEEDLDISANVYFASTWDLIELAVDFEFKPPWYLQIDLQNSELGYYNASVPNHILGVNLSAEAQPLDWLSLYLRCEYRREWFARDSGWDLYRSQLQATGGAVVRLECGLLFHLGVVYTGAFERDVVRNPRSVLAPGYLADIPARTYLLARLGYDLDFGPSRVRLGLSAFNPFGARFSEKLGIDLSGGGHYGGEVLGTRIMATAALTWLP